MKGVKIAILTILILLLLIFLALPIGIGLWTEHAYKKFIAALPPTASVSVKLVKYKLGWFHSTATIVVDLHPQNPSPLPAKNNDVRIIFYNDIKQGPVIFAKKPNGAKKTIFALSQTVTHAPSINLKSTTTWQFDNTIKSLFSSKQFELNLSGMALEIKGLRAAATYDVSKSRWQGNVNIDSGSLSSQPSPRVPPTTLATFSDVAYSGNVYRIGLLGYGKQSLSFSTLKIMTSQENDQNNPVINNVTFTSNVGHNKGATNFQLTLKADKVENTKFDVNSFALAFGVEGLNTNALNKLLKISREQNKVSKNSALFTKISQASMDLFRQGFSLKLSQLNLGTDQGPVEIKGYVTLPALGKKDNVMKATTLAAGELQLQVPKQWFLSQVTHSMVLLGGKNNNTSIPPESQATAMVRQWENDGYLIASGNDYVATINYEDGKFLINGKVPDLKKKPVIQTEPPTQTQPSIQTEPSTQTQPSTPSQPNNSQGQGAR